MNDRSRKMRARTNGPECRSGQRRINSETFTSLESLKLSLLAEELATATDSDLHARLLVAADESAALAWTTPLPLLALPELLAEKEQKARNQFHHQRRILERAGTRVSFAA